jgi:hypothetical protein
MSNHMDGVMREIRAAIVRTTAEREATGSEFGSEGCDIGPEVDACIAIAREYMPVEAREAFDAMPIMVRVGFVIGEV